MLTCWHHARTHALYPLGALLALARAWAWMVPKAQGGPRTDLVRPPIELISFAASVTSCWALAAAARSDLRQQQQQQRLTWRLPVSGFEFCRRLVRTRIRWAMTVALAEKQDLLLELLLATSIVSSVSSVRVPSSQSQGLKKASEARCLHDTGHRSLSPARHHHGSETFRPDDEAK
jgi:hypothetical protein